MSKLNLHFAQISDSSPLVCTFGVLGGGLETIAFASEIRNSNQVEMGLSVMRINQISLQHRI